MMNGAVKRAATNKVMTDRSDLTENDIMVVEEEEPDLLPRTLESLVFLHTVCKKTPSERLCSPSFAYRGKGSIKLCHPVCLLPAFIRASRDEQAISNPGIDTYAWKCKTVVECVTNSFPDWDPHQVDEFLSTDLNTLVRDPSIPVGISNLGATCYLNSFIQSLYMNKMFRETLYTFSPENTSDPNEDFEVILKLQSLFGALQHSPISYISAEPFVTALDLVVTEQQDAQEFNKLLLDCIEHKLALSNEPSVRNLMSNQFRGNLTYQTLCTSCHSCSSSSSSFYELSLQIEGMQGLAESLAEFFKVEQLKGDSLYLCSSCESKQIANRKIEITEWPDVLNIQLLRFQFDYATGAKKKLSAKYDIPIEFEVSDTLHYDLVAVLQHLGTTAYSGHYIADIINPDTQVWSRFDDAIVENRDMDLKRPEGGDRPLYFTSQNAYMLSYRRRGTRVSSDISPDLPIHVENEISLAAEEYRANSDAFNKCSSLVDGLINTRRNDIGKVLAEYEHTFANAPTLTPDVLVLTVDFVVGWIAGKHIDDFELGYLGNSPEPMSFLTNFLCPHNLLSRELSSGKVLLLPGSCSEILFPFASKEQLSLVSAHRLACTECFLTEESIKLVDDEAIQAAKFANMAIGVRSRSKNDNGYNVSEDWIKRFSAVCKTATTASDFKKCITVDANPNSKTLTGAILLLLWEPLTCEHGNLTRSSSHIKFISIEALDLLIQAYHVIFGIDVDVRVIADCIEELIPSSNFRENRAENCLICSETKESQEHEQKAIVSSRNEQFEVLKGVLQDRALSSCAISELVYTGQLYVVPRSWHSNYITYLSSRKVRDIGPLRLSKFICEHNMLMFDLRTNESAERMSLVTDLVWDAIQSATVIEPESLSTGISITFHSNELDRSSTIESISLDLCEPCCIERRQVELRNDEEFVEREFIVEFRSTPPSISTGRESWTPGGRQRLHRTSKSGTFAKSRKAPMTLSFVDNLYGILLRYAQYSDAPLKDLEIYVDCIKMDISDGRNLKKLGIRSTSNICIVENDDSPIDLDNDAADPMEHFLVQSGTMKNNGPSENGFSGTKLSSIKRKREEVPIIEDTDEWSCAQCTLTNSPGHLMCNACSSPRC